MSKKNWVIRPTSGIEGNVYYDKARGLFTEQRPHQIADEGFYTSPSYLPNAPMKVYFDMTYLCNLNCKHCITNSSPWKDTRQELHSNRIFEIVDELAEIGVLEIAVGGGEPMVHPYWFFIFKHITDLGMNLIITTNGLLLNERNLQYLRTIKPLETRISFDGGRSLHNSIRGKDTYDRALKGLKNLVKNKLKCAARFTYCRGAEAEMEDLFADIAETGCKTVKIAMIKNAGRAKDNSDLLAPMPDFDTAMWFLGLGKKYNLNVQLSGDDFPISYIEANDPKLRNEERKNCGAGFETCYISPYGQVFSCVTIPTMEFGKLHEESFTSVWQGQKANNFRKEALSCSSCRLCDSMK
jgi:MoaA/NifB/PqqE/SkfB family radical SAM enzyme